MKTKFSQIVKVKKRRVDEIESELLDARNRKRSIQKQIKDIVKDIAELQTPTSGEFAKINLAHSYLLNLSNQKRSKDSELEKIEHQINGLKELYKEANIEYEKIMYLHNSEIKKHLEELKRQESKNLDEIANILHGRIKIKEEV